MSRLPALAIVLCALASVAQGQEVDHSKMDHSKMGHAMPDDPESLPLPPPPAPSQDAPRTPIPPITDADRAAARLPGGGHAAHGESIHTFIAFDRLEHWQSNESSGLAWDVHGWSGTDLHRLWFRSEGESGEGEAAHHEIELLYGRSVSAWWDVVLGLQHDAQPVARDSLALGVIGLAPYKIETQAMLYLRNGSASARLELEYDTLLGPRWILQSQLELSAESRRDEARGIGAGFSQAEFGLRLRYERHRQLTPYIGIVREQRFGATADLAREEGESSGDWRWVAGVRAWF